MIKSDKNNIFWNYKFGLARSMYDWILFQLVKDDRNCIQGNFLPYKLIKNCVYLVQSWIFNLLRDFIEGLKYRKINKKLIQNSICLFVEYAFGTLKENFII